MTKVPAQQALFAEFAKNPKLFKGMTEADLKQTMAGKNPEVVDAFFKQGANWSRDPNVARIAALIVGAEIEADLQKPQTAAVRKSIAADRRGLRVFTARMKLPEIPSPDAGVFARAAALPKRMYWVSVPGAGFYKWLDANDMSRFSRMTKAEVIGFLPQKTLCSQARAEDYYDMVVDTLKKGQSTEFIAIRDGDFILPKERPYNPLTPDAQTFANAGVRKVSYVIMFKHATPRAIKPEDLARFASMPEEDVARELGGKQVYTGLVSAIMANAHDDNAFIDAETGVFEIASLDS